MSNEKLADAESLRKAEREYYMRMTAEVAVIAEELGWHDLRRARRMMALEVIPWAIESWEHARTFGADLSLAANVASALKTVGVECSEEDASTAVEVWERQGRPQKTTTHLPAKWTFFARLLSCFGPIKTKSLEADWRAWRQARRSQKGEV